MDIIVIKIQLVKNMKNNDTYDYNPTDSNPNADIPIDILNYIPIYVINNTYDDDSWRIVGITELIITSPYC